MEAKFPVDVNLPYLFNHWNSSEFIHQHDIDARLPDRGIWDDSK